MGILTQNLEYKSRYCGNFRGVDFSSDHTQVNPSRLAYLVNMYKDYHSGQGEALETIAGFRQRVVLPMENNQKPVIYGVFNFEHKVNGVKTTKVLIHAGSKIWLWHNYPNTINIETAGVATLPAPVVASGLKTFTTTLSYPCYQIISITTNDGIELTNAAGYAAMTANTFKYEPSTQELIVCCIDGELSGDPDGYARLSEGSTLSISYKEGVILATDTPLFANMNNAKSTSFIVNNKLYIVDGQNYLVYDGSTIKSVIGAEDSYIPTTYINAIPGGENKSIGTQYEQRNYCQPKFRQTYVGDGTTTLYELNDGNLSASVVVKVGGVVQEASAYVFDSTNGTVTFTTAPATPSVEGNANVEIIAEKALNVIEKCTLATTFDGRVFMSGNPDYPNNLYFCGRSAMTGLADPTYFGILNYVQDGVGIAPITGIMGVSDTLMVLKSDTQQDSSVYFHKGQDSSNNIIPRIYPSYQGLSGLGCLGACTSFRDDPIFISRLGVEAMGQLKIASERAIEHRSSLVDAKLVNSNLANAIVEEYAGYLCIIVDGDMYLADSRQIYQDSTGVNQYEWYYVSGLGVYDGQYKEYRYAEKIPNYLTGKTVTATIEENTLILPLEIIPNDYLEGNEERIANPPIYGEESRIVYHNNIEVPFDDNTNIFQPVDFVVNEIKDLFDENLITYKAFFVKSQGNYTGGTFKKASAVKSMDNNLFFGTENGVLCSFNFDKRDSMGEIPSSFYSFDNRTIISGAATLMDNCGIPHLTKTTVRGSTVIKTKSFRNSAAKIKVRTNKSAYEQIARINTSLFAFDIMDFEDMTFNTDTQSLFAVNEKEKKWVEKQYFILSDEYLKPFSLFYVSYRYKVAGRFKG